MATTEVATTGVVKHVVAENGVSKSGVAKDGVGFMEFGIASLDASVPGQGARILSQLEGAMLLARSAGSLDVFRTATENLVLDRV